MNVKRSIIRNWSNRISNIHINNITIAINMYNNIRNIRRYNFRINWYSIVGMVDICNISLYISLFNHNGSVRYMHKLKSLIIIFFYF